jgi:hypothetical protein
MMSTRHASETALAWVTLLATSVHFTLETWYHLMWGQPLEALLVDYICVALMVLGGLRSLWGRPSSAAGLLAAAWAYALGFAWRSVFGRIELLEAGAGTANGEPGYVLPVLMGALVIVAAVLLWALWLAWLQTGKPSR